MDNTQFLLLKIIEECSEVQQIASKCMQFGMLEKHPDLEQNNLERLRSELADLRDTVSIFENVHGGSLSLTDTGATYRNRKLKLEKYKRYSFELGMVQEPSL